MAQAKRKEKKTELINDPGETRQERISRVIDEVLSGEGPHKPHAKSFLLPAERRKRSVLTTEAVSRALVAAGGKISYAAIILGITPSTLRQKVRDSEELTSLKEEIQELRLDIAEDKLDGRVLADKWPAIQFALETQGKHRGYTKRTELTGPEGNRLIFEFSDGSIDKNA